MSGRLLSARLKPLAQKVNISAARHIHHSSAGGLLRSDTAVRVARRRIWPAGYTQFSNAVVVRNASFARILPKLFIKLARIPALFAGATITGLAYLQYQATRRSSQNKIYQNIVYKPNLTIYTDRFHRGGKLCSGCAWPNKGYSNWSRWRVI
jgi:hypothetical protein